MKVPDILVSGNHKEIELWRKEKMMERTMARRKDLIYEELAKKDKSITNKEFFKKYKSGLEDNNYPDW